MRMILTAALAAIAVAGSPAAHAQTYWDGHNYYERPQPLPAPPPASAAPRTPDPRPAPASQYDRAAGRYDQDLRDQAARYGREDEDFGDDRYGRDDIRNEAGDGRDDENRYLGWRRDGSWGQHVRACMSRYRSYNARTDSYLARPGVWVRCGL
ncbi:BA14K family protein [Phenylobacterium sp.]|uniref:BA14K family protein n=1 Tax=Phenylobacterium sp. TaxID=1871053 RepID=UPI0027375D9C|nr:BA14K family protein [Phenylobacterium sp.]MDP3659064.1 BA14K family protein [Phenylobacterium sp.]